RSLDSMKYDCPNCQRSLEGVKLMRRADAYGIEAFDCPHCGERLDYYKHPVEALVVFALLAWVVWFAAPLGFTHDFVTVFAVGLIAVIPAVAIVWLVARGSPRYRIVRREV